MNITIIRTEGYGLLAEVECDGEHLGVMDDFSAMPPHNIDFTRPEFSHLTLHDYDWETMFAGNPHKQKKMVRTGNWSYDAYGQLVSIGPVVADFGLMSLELGIVTHDPRCVGEWILAKIERLDLSFRSK